MQVFTGKSILDGISIGKVYFLAKKEAEVSRKEVEDVEGEILRYEEAKEAAKAQVKALYKKALAELGETEAMIFEAHAILIDDEEYKDYIYHMIRSEAVSAEYAVSMTGQHFATMFAELEDDYFKARSADVKDISERIIRILQKREENGSSFTEPVILVAEDLAPSETVQLDKSKLLSFVTRLGSANSHTAILARTMNLPSLTGVEIDPAWHGHVAIVDGKGEKLILDPDQKTMENYEKLLEAEKENKALLMQYKGLPDKTKDGRHIDLFANIGSVADVASVFANDAAGIGLLRSEFLYLEKSTYPTEEEQFQSYKTIAQNMAGKKVVIRTLDIGADKQVDYFNLDHEDNPAMGYRAIRICLDRREIFKTQLRALYRASAYGNISIMFPMIISVEEVREIKEICEEVKAELSKDDLNYGEVELGIMIETPAAVMISDLLAKEVDFFSIGTNDLTQYTLAIDRQNSKLDKHYNAHHEAILRMIQLVIDNGHKENCWVGICGELAADTSLTETFIQMGIDELSVSPTFILPVRQAIRQSTYKN